jgi:hypothetical protein
MLLDEDPATVRNQNMAGGALLTFAAHSPHNRQLQHYTRQTCSLTYK